MSAGGIYILVSQDIGHQIYIPCLTIERCAVGGTQFMRSDTLY